jgi:hypothetical protein
VRIDLFSDVGTHFIEVLMEEKKGAYLRVTGWETVPCLLSRESHPLRIYVCVKDM